MRDTSQYRGVGGPGAAEQLDWALDTIAPLPAGWLCRFGVGKDFVVMQAPWNISDAGITAYDARIRGLALDDPARLPELELPYNGLQYKRTPENAVFMGRCRSEEAHTAEAGEPLSGQLLEDCRALATLLRHTSVDISGAGLDFTASVPRTPNGIEAKVSGFLHTPADYDRFENETAKHIMILDVKETGGEQVAPGFITDMHRMYRGIMKQGGHPFSASFLYWRRQVFDQA